MQQPISDAVRRFVLTSIPTVPHMEALLLVWREPAGGWSTEDLARRLFVTRELAQTLAEELCDAGLLECGGDPRLFCCRRDLPSLAALLGELDAAYASNLRQITGLIHSNMDRKAERFAQAFNWEKK